MSDPTDLDAIEQAEQDGDPSQLRAAQKAAAQRATDAEERATNAERRMAFLEAGVDLKSEVGQLLFDAYKGELTEEAIKAKAQAIGAIKTDDPAPALQAPDVTDDERQQAAERAALGSDVSAPGGIPPADPRVEGWAAFQADLQDGRQRDEAAAQYLDRVMEAAYLHKDPRVVHNQAQWEADNRGSAKAR